MPTNPKYPFSFLASEILLCTSTLLSCQGASSEKDNLSSLQPKVIPHQITTETDTKDSLAIKGIEEIPASVFERKDLKYLSVWGQDCDCNIPGIECYAIDEIPAAIENLKQLEELRLTLNYITKLPPEILQLKNLRILDLTENSSFNDIQTLSQMNWLEAFYCFGCHLSEEEVEQLKVSLPNCKIGV